MDQLAQDLQDSVLYTADKTDAPFLIPVAEWRQMRRKKANIVRMASIFIVDLDRLDQDQYDALLETLDPVSCIVYPSYSNLSQRKDYTYCIRAIIELDREYEPEHYPTVWDSLNRRLGGLIDPATRAHPELGYHIPSAPYSSGTVTVLRNSGNVWVVDDLIAKAAPLDLAETTAPSGTPPSVRAVKIQIGAWARGARDQESANLALAAKALLEGKNTIPVGEGVRNDTLIRLAGHLANMWPDSRADGIAQTFEGVGWDQLNIDRKYPLESFASMIERCQESTRAQRAQEQSAKIQHATCGERTTTVTPDEIRDLEERYGEDWAQHLIAVRNKDCYLLRPDGTYNPIPHLKDNLLLACRDHFTVFGDHVEYAYQSADGPKRKTLQQFLEEYGTVINNVIFDLCRPHGGWDAKTRTIFLPVGIRQAEPVEHPEIQAWLGCMDPILCDVISQLTQHEFMCPALVLTGTKNTGKTLLANGVSQIYSEGPTMAKDAFSEFNGNELRRCPIIFMDEASTEQYKKEGTTLLRRFLSQRSWALNEKYQTRTELRGFFRLLIAANSEEILATTEEMTAEDRNAFSERLVHVNMDPGREVLEQYDHKYIQKNWLDGRMLAEHALFLCETWQVQNPGTRFVVQQPKNTFHAGISSRAGTPQDVLYWLLSYLQNPAPAIAAHWPIEVKDNQLRVHPEAIIKHWEAYHNAHRIPSPAAIAIAVRAISTGREGRRKLAPSRGSRNSYTIDTDQLRAANERFGVLDDLDVALSRETSR
jgi:hypothetical protein